MYSMGLAMTIRPGCYDEYKKAHDELWPEIAEGMTANDIDMVIYRLGNRLIIHATAPTQAHMEERTEQTVTARWNEYMGKLLETDEQGQIIFEPLEEAFAFGRFKTA
ncbi:MAG: L-rhamnose mutarotase [Candidatus Latescibacteria bacterium]|nr:L-rhamnose mutarotase [Candidatus Latescibacterota bacterium]